MQEGKTKCQNKAFGGIKKSTDHNIWFRVINLQWFLRRVRNEIRKAKKRASKTADNGEQFLMIAILAVVSISFLKIQVKVQKKIGFSSICSCITAYHVYHCTRRILIIRSYN